MKLRNNKSVSQKNQENRSMKQDEAIVFIDEVDIPQTSRKRKIKSSLEKSSKLYNEKDKSSNGLGSSGDSRNNVGLVKKKNGNFGVKIHDRIRKKDVWLGTYCSAEEASKVYWAKKEELEKEFEVIANNIVTILKTKRTSKFVGVSRRASGKFVAHIRDPIRKKKLYLGAFDIEEDASKAYLAKKKELMEEVKKGKTGARWYLGRREFRKPESLIIRKRRNFGEEPRKRRKVREEIEHFEDDSIDPCSDAQESSTEIDDFDSSSSGESESSGEGISKEENEESIVFIDEVDVPQTSRKRKNKPSSGKSSKLYDKMDKYSDGVDTSGASINNVGLVKRKNGNFGVKIYDRIRKKDVWLGTYCSAEEASKVYWAKKEELEKEFEVVAKNVVMVEETKRTSKFVGVSRRASGKSVAHIEKDASKAYLAEKEELMEKGKEGKTGEDRCLEDDQVYSRNSDHSDSLDSEKAANDDETLESPIIKEENGEPCSDDQEPLEEEINHVVTSEKEAVSIAPIASEHDLPIQKNGVKDESIDVDSSVQSPVNPGNCSNSNVLLRTNSGTPLVDSNGLLLGEWSWIDDYGLSIK